MNSQTVTSYTPFSSDMSYIYATSCELKILNYFIQIIIIINYIYNQILSKYILYLKLYILFYYFSNIFSFNTTKKEVMT